jgi:hypothetical protein
MERDKQEIRESELKLLREEYRWHRKEVELLRKDIELLRKTMEEISQPIPPIQPIPYYQPHYYGETGTGDPCPVCGKLNCKELHITCQNNFDDN